MPKGRKKGLHDGGGSIFHRMASNVKKNAKPETFTRAGYGILGALLYALVPTAIQGWFKKDMTGWKGVSVGLITASLIGMAADKIEMVVGAFAGFGLHFTYIYANDTIATFLGSPIFRFSAAPANIPLSPATTGVSDAQLGPNQVLIPLPDGRQIVAAKSPAPGMNDFQTTLKDYQAELQDFQTDLHDGYGNEMRGERHKLNDFVSTLNDQRMFRDRTMKM